MSKPRRKPDYRLEELDGELLLFHPGQGRILYCNPSASLIWHLCDGDRTSAEIGDLLAEAYPEAAADIARDVGETLALFLQHGAIEFV